MPYSFEQNDRSVQKAVRHIAMEQIDKAMKSADATGDDLKEAVHQARKCCKKLRGLIRLVRPVFEDYTFENAAFRDAARDLSHARDAEVLVKSCEMLMQGAPGREAAFATTLDVLRARRDEVAGADSMAGILPPFRERMAKAHRRARTWKISGSGFAALSGGLKDTYRRARKAMEHAASDRDAVAIHDWRKHVKYHWYHTRLLAPVWPESMAAHDAAAETLGEMLGMHHDLTVLRDLVAREPDAFGDAGVVLETARLQQRRLERDAFALGARLLAETPPALVERWGGYWTAWRREASVRDAA